MKITMHVATVEEIPAAREAAEAVAQPEDEIEIIVGLSTPVARQEPRPAAGIPGGQKG